MTSGACRRCVGKEVSLRQPGMITPLRLQDFLLLESSYQADKGSLSCQHSD